MSTPEPRRVSASRLAALDQCSMKFYLSEILKLPEKVWPRTSAGSATHGILECLARDKHRAHHDAIKAAKTIHASPAVTRLLRAWQWKLQMPDEIVADIDGMCMVAILHTNFLDEGAVRRFGPEHEFRFTLPNGGIVKGFIDRAAEFPGGRFVITDFKTARVKHSKQETEDSFQSLVYQTYFWLTFGVLAEAHYHFLRHPPTPRAPDKHIMITPPPSENQLKGFMLYLASMYEVINRFGEAEAEVNYCADTGFCDRVCSHRHPRQYTSIRKRATGELVKNYMLGTAPEPKEDEVAETLYHGGCKRWNP